MAFTNSELADMHLTLGESNGNLAQCRRLYGDKFPLRRLPNPRFFQTIDRHLRETGRFVANHHDAGRPRSLLTPALEQQVLAVLEENPNISMRRGGAQLGIPRNSFWRVAKEQLLHPYHLQRVQQLKPEDYPRRVRFSNWIIDNYREDPQILEKILFTDEATFTREGIFNTRNLHQWAEENPHAYREFHFQNKFSLNVWAGILGNELIGPFVLEHRLTGEHYLNFLTNTLPILLENVSLQTRREIIFMHDGAPPHATNAVTTFLHTNFPNRWIGRGDRGNPPIVWPPRSPDLTPLDFYLWGAMKDLVYARTVATVEELQQRIMEAAALQRGLGAGMFLTVRGNLIRRCRTCIRANGRHFEHLL